MYRISHRRNIDSTGNRLSGYRGCGNGYRGADMGRRTLLAGRTIRFTGNPFEADVDDAIEYREGGGVLIEDGRILECGDAESLRQGSPDAVRHDFPHQLLIPGFIDAHVHYPQTAIIASWGKLDWLGRYTFPEEMKFEDPSHARKLAARYLDLVVSHGTTTVCSYCTTHPQSADAIFAEAGRRRMRLAAGKICMDRNAPAELCDNAARSYDESRALIDKWHGKDRLTYAISPRFALTSSRQQLEVLGVLWQENPGCLMQTHLSEQTEEVAEIRRLFPEARDYLDVYDSCGLVGDRALFGHAIHLNDRELDRLKAVGASLIHCPTSNTFIGSGLFDIGRRIPEGQRVGLATDTGGGSSFSMLRTMAAAYEIGQLQGCALHPGQLLWLATRGNAEALGMDHAIGNLAAGNEADIAVLDLHSTPAIAQRASRADDVWEEIFPTIMMGDERAIHSVWVNGKEVGKPARRECSEKS